MIESKLSQAPLHLFEGYGVELEYMIVDPRSLNVKAVADELFHRLTGKWTNLVPCGELDMDNELAAHVVEIKNVKPVKNLVQLHKLFQDRVVDIASHLHEMGAALLPTAMHPWMDPYKELRLWPHGDKAIYDTLHRIFDCRGHGWANLQSTHLNLPFCGDEEFCKLHQAIRLVLPLIPTLSASSPYIEGRWSGVYDQRLLTYRDNSKKIPSITGHIIPEVCHSVSEYRMIILEKIWKDMRPFDPHGILRYEWINARGAIARFDRMAIEIRLIDIQEAPVMDLTLVQVIIECLQHLVSTDAWHLGDRWSCAALKLLLEQAISQADNTTLSVEWLELMGLRSQYPMSSQQFWKRMTEEGIIQAKGFEQSWALFLEEGTLAHRMLKIGGKKPDEASLHHLYDRLAQGLCRGEPFVP